MSNFGDAQLKVDRANKHIQDAENIVLSLADHYTVRVHQDPCYSNALCQLFMIQSPHANTAS